MSQPLKIAIIIGSTRPGRRAEAVARWVFDVAAGRKDATFDLVDLKDFNLPLFDEPMSPAIAPPTKNHSRAWSQKIGLYDGFVFVTPEYNHSMPGALKNAIDFLYKEWNDKAAGFVSYGAAGGVRAVEHLRGVLAEVQVADVRGHVALSLFTDFENFTAFKPAAAQEGHLNAMLDQLVAWSGALKTLRERALAAAA